MLHHLERDSAYGYMSRINATCTQALEERGGHDRKITQPLTIIQTLAILESAWLVHLKALDANPRVPITNTGFPSLPTWMADAAAAIELHETESKPKKLALQGIIADFAVSDAHALSTKANDRAAAITADTEVTKIVHPISKDNFKLAVGTIHHYKEHKKNTPREYLISVQEEGDILTTHRWENEQWKDPVGFKFIPIGEKNHLTGWHPFFLIFGLNEIHEMGDYRREGFIPDSMMQVINTYNSEEKKVIKASPQYPVDVSLYRLTHQPPNTAIDRFLKSYDPLAFEGQNDNIFALVCELNDSFISLVNLANVSLHRQNMKDHVEIQQKAALVLSKIDNLPTPVAERLRAMVADATTQGQRDVERNMLSLYR